ncbi:hypothetical protein [Neptunomonas phycophila]|uniref:hypothetical protein n=1 Tax=Neptunomonas phycophila TaxID=1572645 RepID=UPI0030F92695
MHQYRKTLLIIPGLPRCATTAVVNLLTQHPDVFSSNIKEPHTLIPEVERSKLWGFDGESKQSFSKLGFIDDEEQYLKNFDFFKEPGVYIDASTLYSVHHSFLNSLENIEAKGIAIKFLILTRDPFKRAYSHYQFSVSRGEDPRNFSDAIREELSGESDGWVIGGYLKGSSLKVVDAILERYSDDTIKIVDIMNDDIQSQAFMSDLNHFLGVSDFQYDLDVYGNESKEYGRIGGFLRKLARKFRSFNPVLLDNKLTRSFFNYFICFLNKYLSKPKGEISDEERQLYMREFGRLK